MNTNTGPLTGIRVIELSGPAGQPCGRALADLGADVILVEPLKGSESRNFLPFTLKGDHPDRSIFFLHFNTNKRSISLDITSSKGQDTLLSLIQTADVLIDSYEPGYMDSVGLSPERIRSANEKLIHASITPFGQTGPYRNFKATDLVSTSISGLVFPEGNSKEAPITMPRYQGYQLPGLHSAFAILIALWHRDKQGVGQNIDISRFEVLANFQLNFLRYSSQHINTPRKRDTAGNGPTQYYQTTDGWVQLALTTERQWTGLVEWMDDPELADEKFKILSVRDANAKLITQKAKKFISNFTTKEFLDGGEKYRVTVAPANTPADFYSHAHTIENKYLTTINHPTLGEYNAPGAPMDFSETPWRISRIAPTIGQHTSEILNELKDRKITHPQVQTKRGKKSLPLDGIRILAFERVWAAPFGTRYLADYGAEVIKIESTKFSDGRVFDKNLNPAAWLGTNATYGEINRNKKSIALDLHSEEGQEIFKRLAEISDVVIENNAPSAMRRFNITYEDLRKVNPRIIMVSCPGFGSQGPLSNYVAVGQSITAFTGLGYLWAKDDAEWPARGAGPYPDFITASNIPLAIMSALHHREKTNVGQFIEIAQFKAAASVIGLATLEDQLSGKPASAWGNQDPNMVSQGIYRCKGNDRWVAISCPSNESWNSLLELIKSSGNPIASEFRTPAGQKQNKTTIDKMISDWTVNLSPHQVMYLCQKLDIPASVVATGEDLYLDPQLRSRNYVVEVEHPIPGKIEHPGMTAKFSETPGQVYLPAPQPGEHTEQILRTLLKIPDSEISDLKESGILS